MVLCINKINNGSYRALKRHESSLSTLISPYPFFHSTMMPVAVASKAALNAEVYAPYLL